MSKPPSSSACRNNNPTGTKPKACRICVLLWNTKHKTFGGGWSKSIVRFENAWPNYQIIGWLDSRIGLPTSGYVRSKEMDSYRPHHTTTARLSISRTDCRDRSKQQWMTNEGQRSLWHSSTEKLYKLRNSSFIKLTSSGISLFKTYRPLNKQQPQNLWSGKAHCTICNAWNFY